MERIAEASPRLKAKLAGVFYLLTILMGVVVLFGRGKLGFAGELIDLGAGAAIDTSLHISGLQGS